MAGWRCSCWAASGVFFVLIALVPRAEPLLVAVWGAVAICLFYWFGVDVLAGGITTLFGVDATVIRWPIRTVVIGLSVIWVSRTMAAHRRYLAETPARGGPVALPLPTIRSRSGDDGSAAPAESPVVRFGADGEQVTCEVGMSVLEAAERAGRPLEAGCRMGVCGADPIAVLDGAVGLVEPDEDEQNTLRRLGYADNTRMACCARLQSGTVTVALTPDPGAAP